MKTRTVLSVGALALALLVTGCAGGPSGPSAQERVDAAQAALAGTNAITIELNSSDVPSNVDGVQAAAGTGVIEGELIKFEGEIQGRVSGMAATVAILAIGDDTYWKLFTPNYEPVDLKLLGVPSPTAFFASDTGFASLLAASGDLAIGGEAREGSEVLTEITGTVPGSSVRALLNLGDAAASFDVTYGLTEGNELRTAVLTGEFWPGATSSYRLLITNYGVVVPIEAP